MLMISHTLRFWKPLQVALIFMRLLLNDSSIQFKRKLSQQTFDICYFYFFSKCSMIIILISIIRLLLICLLQMAMSKGMLLSENLHLKIIGQLISWPSLHKILRIIIGCDLFQSFLNLFILCLNNVHNWSL